MSTPNTTELHRETETLRSQLDEANKMLGKAARSKVDTEQGEPINTDAAIWERCAAYWHKNAVELCGQLDALKLGNQLLKTTVATQNEKDNPLHVRIGELTAERDALKAQVVVKDEALKEALDELHWTERGDYPRELYCRRCCCNVSRGQPHESYCHIPQMESALSPK